jgi:hypothetical protein
MPIFEKRISVLNTVYHKSTRLIKWFYNVFNNYLGSCSHSQLCHWSYYTVNFSSCENIINNFRKFSLKTKKRFSFEKWEQVYVAIKSKLHLIPEKREKLVVLSKSINPQKNSK